MLAVVATTVTLVLSPTSAVSGAGDPDVGVHVHAVWLDLDETERGPLLDRVVATGMDRIRVDLSWASIESAGPGTVDAYWDDRIDDVLRDATTRDLSVLAVVWQTPPWASASGAVSAVPDDPRAFGRFLESFAARHGDRVDAWEIWNEPNEDDFFAGDAEDYVALLAPAAAALRRTDPTADVVLGAPTYNDTNWLREVYDAGARPHFDVLATHPYMAPSDLPPETREDGNIWLLTHVDEVRDLMVARGDADKPIWFTEFGWHLRPPAPDQEPWDRGVDAATQADYLVRTIDQVAADHPWVEAVYWYNARERTDSHARDNTYGLVRTDLVPKPAWWAAQARLRGTVRTAGGDRIDTAIAAAELGWPLGATVAVVARSDLPSDALVATPLAATLDAPILLTPRGELDPRTARALDDLGVSEVTVVGGPDAVADDVLQAIAGRGTTVRRLAGNDRADTAAIVAGQLPGQATVVVDGWPRGDDTVWHDAVVAAGIATADDPPRAIVLADREMPPATVDVLDERTGAVTVVGTGMTHGRQLVDGVAAGRTNVVVGDDVVATSEAALTAHPHEGDGPLLLATSAVFPDGLVAAALGARLGGRVVLVDPSGDASRATATTAGRLWTVLGGPDALPASVLPDRHRAASSSSSAN